MKRSAELAQSRRRLKFTPTQIHQGPGQSQASNSRPVAAWRRNGSFVARITVEDEAGHKAVKWVPWTGSTLAKAQDEFRTLLVERSKFT